MEPITLYYNHRKAEIVVRTIEGYANLYYDVECTKIAGYYYVSIIKNAISYTNSNVSITLYFNDRIITYSYAKIGDLPITTPIISDNLWDSKKPIGYVNRIILPNGTTRKITINS